MLRNDYRKKLLAKSIEVSLSCVFATVALCRGPVVKPGGVHCKGYKLELQEL